MDPGPRWIYGFTLGSFIGPLILVAAHEVLWEFREVWWEAPTGDDMQYFGLMCGLFLAGVILLVPSVLVGGWACARVARTRPTRCCTEWHFPKL